MSNIYIYIYIYIYFAHALLGTPLSLYYIISYHIMGHCHITLLVHDCYYNHDYHMFILLWRCRSTLSIVLTAIYISLA